MARIYVLGTRDGWSYVVLLGSEEQFGPSRNRCVYWRKPTLNFMTTRPKRSLRPPFHPFGYASTGNRDLAFIRISKNASSSIVASLGLKGWTHASCLENHAVYCALRDPVARFYSSVVETTLRARLFQDHKYFGDIVVDPEIYFEMQRLLARGDVAAYLWYIIEMIDEVGPFDAHHERQVSFLRDFEAHPHDIAFFNVDDTDVVLAELLKTYSGVQSDANRRKTRRRSRFEFEQVRLKKMRIKQRMFAKPVSPRHLLFNHENGFGPVRHGSRVYNAGSAEFYEQIRAAATPELDRKVARVYGPDMALFERVSAGPSFVRAPLVGLL